MAMNRQRLNLDTSCNLPASLLVETWPRVDKVHHGAFIARSGGTAYPRSEVFAPPGEALSR
jgi:hypothetical protein